MFSEVQVSSPLSNALFLSFRDTEREREREMRGKKKMRRKEQKIKEKEKRVEVVSGTTMAR